MQAGGRYERRGRRWRLVGRAGGRRHDPEERLLSALEAAGLTPGPVRRPILVVVRGDADARRDEGDPAAIEDAALVARIGVGDASAMTLAYDRHADIVYGSLVRFLGDREAAEDVVQETFLVLWQRADLFDPRRGSLLGWLLGIARNRAIDRLRAARRRPEVVVSWTSHGAGGDRGSRADPMAAIAERAGGSIGDDPESAAARSWTRSVVRAALSAMPEAERQVLRLAYDGGLSQSEIASRLGQPLGTVKTRTRRALAELRAVLESVPDLAPRSARSTGRNRATGGPDGSR